MKRSLNPNEKAISEALMLFLVMVLFYPRNTRGSPRHIEIQIMADSHGISCIYSKRMQHTTSPSKVIEELFLYFNTRITKKKMGEAAVLVIESCDYLVQEQ
jgi:propionyl-CoA carboxylase alpha chain